MRTRSHEHNIGGGPNIGGNKFGVINLRFKTTRVRSVLVHRWRLVGQVVVAVDLFRGRIDLGHFWVLLVEVLLELLFVELFGLGLFLFTVLVLLFLGFFSGFLFKSGLGILKIFIIALFALLFLFDRSFAVELDVFNLVTTLLHIVHTDLES